MADEQPIEETLPPLEPRQELFCQEYIKDFNGTQAAIRSGYSVASAKEIASENLTKPNIAAKIKELKDNIFAAVGITQHRIYTELRRLALVDVSGIFDENGALKSLTDMDADTRAAIVGIEVDDIFEWVGNTKQNIGQTKKVKLADKLNAIAQIVKIAGWASAEKHELSGPNGGPVESKLSDTQFDLLLNKIHAPIPDPGK